MQRFFTKNIFLLALALISVSAFAQVNTLRVTAPTGLAGDYTIARFNWGPLKSTELSGVAEFAVDATAPVNDACSVLTNDLTGNIAFIDRGTCGISDKVDKAEKAGAIAAIICNTATGTPASNISPGALGLGLKINAYMMTNADCVKLRTRILAGEVTVELKANAANCAYTYDPDAFWGNVKGQGDFALGLNEWTIENGDPSLDTRTTWFHSETGFPRSAVSFSTGDIASNSKCNGAAVMDLFTLQLEDNPNTTQPYNRYESSLISPPIDCRGKNSIILQLTMVHNRLNGNATISFFDGTNWSDARTISTNNAVNVSAVSETVTYPLPEFSGKEGCRVRITVEGDFYYFILDDVVMLNKSIVDVRVNKNWYSTSPTLRVPKEQVAEFPLMADIENVGNTAAANTVLKVEIKDDADVLLETLTNDYGSVDGSAVVENDIFATLYTPMNVPGRYTGNYIISSSSESADNLANNTADFEFYVTENTFGNIVPEAEVGQAYLEDIADSWAVSNAITNYYSGGNVYFVKNGTNKTVSEVRFGLQNPASELHERGEMYVDLFELSEPAGVSDPEKRTLIGTGSILLDSNTIADFRNISVNVFEPTSEGGPSTRSISLKDNTSYFLTINTAPFDASFERFRILQYSGNGNDIFDRSIYPAPNNFALDSLDLNRSCGTYWQREGVGYDYPEIRSRIYARTGNETFNTWSMLYLEMDVVNKISTYDIDKSAIISTFPNPASREIYVDVDLTDVSDVRIDLVTIDGKVATSQNFSGVQDSRMKVDLSNVGSGAYTLLVHTNKGVSAKKVIVAK